MATATVLRRSRGASFFRHATDDPRALGKNLEAMNSAVRTLAESDKAIVVVQTSHLPHQHVHLATKGTLLLGEEMAKAFLKAK